jgi:hypothetical protein
VAARAAWYQPISYCNRNYHIINHPADRPENKFLEYYLVIRYIRITYCPKSLSSVLILNDIDLAGTSIISSARGRELGMSRCAA